MVAVVMDRWQSPVKPQQEAQPQDNDNNVDLPF